MTLIFEGNFKYMDSHNFNKKFIGKEYLPNYNQRLHFRRSSKIPLIVNANECGTPIKIIETLGEGENIFKVYVKKIFFEKQ